MTGRPARMRGRALTCAAALGLLATLGVGAAAAAPPAATTAPAATGSASAEAPVDLNTATEQQLIDLPGIGPALARRILAHREEHGAFRRVEDLLKVKGIGEKSFQKLRPRITVAKRDS